jgi:hypothetical protein
MKLEGGIPGKAFGKAVGRPDHIPLRVELNCTTTDDDHACTRGNDQDGFFICRGHGKPFSDDREYRTQCVNKARGFPGDTCGCCDGTCPETCECTCELPNGDAGIAINMTSRFGLDYKFKCVDESKATLRIANGRVTCPTDCSAVVIDDDETVTQSSALSDGEDDSDEDGGDGNGNANGQGHGNANGI